MAVSQVVQWRAWKSKLYVEQRGDSVDRSDHPLLGCPLPTRVRNNPGPSGRYLLLLIPHPYILAGNMTDASQPSGTPLVSFITSHSTISEFITESLLSDVRGPR
jgi:hypothetical protein